MKLWRIGDNENLYWMQAWGENFFKISESGHVIVIPKAGGASIDLYELVQSLVQRGIEAPILVRFDDIIKERIRRLHAAFDSAIQESAFENRYQIAYPIKVNPQRTVVESVLKASKAGPVGLEVGSKPELLSVLAMEQPEILLLCNGYKDPEYMELALLGSKLGKRSIIIIEQSYELKLVLQVAEKLGIEADLGFRIKPSAKGTGRWESSGGEAAKFGLNSDEVVSLLEELERLNKKDWLKLLHFHIGSQITSIGSIKKALEEGSRFYAELAKECPSLSYFDAGGGLGIDYDGSKTSSDSSVNYTIEEYARDVTYSIRDACDKAGIKHPAIITESGRAIVAHHSVLIIEVIDVAKTADPSETIQPPSSDQELLQSAFELYETANIKNCQEVLHDALELKDKVLDSFNHEVIRLRERAYAENALRHVFAKVRNLSKELKYIPKDMEDLDKHLYDTYFCNFSLFQSLPDAWAIGQLFPIMPIHRLNEEPVREAIIADLSCDSDGKIDRFVHPKESKHTLGLHEFGKDPYYLGIFLVGAYQEILGGLHNLFGDTNAVHVNLDKNGHPEINYIVEGDTIEEVLIYAQYNVPLMLERLHKSIERSLKAGALSHTEAAKLQKKFRESLESYTYLVD